MRKTTKIVLMMIIIFMVLITTRSYVNADMGPKPSITIKLTNMNTTDYLIDLLVYDEGSKNYSVNADYNGEGLTPVQIEKLHDLNIDGWISEGTRWSAYLLFADCAGNSNFEHRFSYFGTPETYKVVVINNRTGEMKVSEVIHRTDYNSSVTIDYSTMKVMRGFNLFSILTTNILPLVLTIIVELIIARIMKINNYKCIAIVNFVTNIVAQIILYIVPLSYLFTFIVVELLVIVTEYMLYKKYFKDITNEIIGKYTLIANITTALLTFIIPFFV